MARTVASWAVPLDLEAIFRSLVMPLPGVSGAQLAAVEIPGTSGYRLAKDQGGLPCVLIQQGGTLASSAPIRLENMSVEFSVGCSITTPAGLQTGTFTIVRCSDSSADLPKHFLRVLSPAIAALGPSPSAAAVRSAVLGLVDLFQALTAPPRNTVQGLFGELLVIKNSHEPRLLAEAWHRDPSELYDFSLGPQRIEVKSSSARRREHFFSLDQLSPPAGVTLVIASLFVSPAGGGTSLGALFAETRALLAAAPALQAHLDTTFYSSLGSSWASAVDDCFDLELAVGSLAFWGAAGVPRPENPFPRIVTDVRFRSDLGSLAPLETTQLIAAGGVLRAVIA